MSEPGSGIETPILLVAMPQVLDPFFNRSVVLLAEHDADGSFGLILNRFTDIEIGTLLHGLEIEWGGDPKLLTSFGGPVQPNLGTVLFGSPLAVDTDAFTVAEIGPGIELSQDIGLLTLLARNPPERFRILLGYAGWGPGQLDAEMERNDWLLAPIDAEIVFADDPPLAWSRALSSIGVRAEQLPSFVRGTEPDKAN